jgi:hypothetical protein
MFAEHMISYADFFVLSKYEAGLLDHRPIDTTKISGFLHLSIPTARLYDWTQNKAQHDGTFAAKPRRRLHGIDHCFV